MELQREPAQPTSPDALRHHRKGWKSVAEAPAALGYRRSNAFIGISDVSLAARRLIDVSFFFVASVPELHKEYRIDYGLFKWLLATTSENRSFVKKLIRQAQGAAILLNEGTGQEERWGSVPLMGEAFIAGGEFIFSVSDRLQKAIKNPEAAHFLSLRFVFTSLYSKILYDHFQPFMKRGLPLGLTLTNCANFWIATKIRPMRSSSTSALKSSK
jgi:hypothetical protein